MCDVHQEMHRPESCSVQLNDKTLMGLVFSSMAMPQSIELEYENVISPNLNLIKRQ